MKTLRRLSVTAAVAGLTLGLCAPPLLASAHPAPAASGTSYGHQAADADQDAEYDSLDGDNGELYLDSIGADPDQSLERVSFDEELGVEIFDSPLGEFYVDPEAGDGAVQVDQDGKDSVTVPGLGEVQFLVADISADELTPEARAEFERAGIDPEELLGGGSAPLRSEFQAPDPELIAAAGACELELGSDAIAGLQECAAAGGVVAPLAEEEVPEEDDGSDSGVDATASTAPPSGCATATKTKYISRIQACASNTVVSRLVNRTGQTIGSFTTVGVSHATTRTNSNTTKIDSNAYVRISATTGVAIGRAFTYSGQPLCGFNCYSAQGSATFVGSSSWTSMTGTVVGDVPTGNANNVVSGWGYTITSPGIDKAAKYTTTSVVPRCDNNTPQLSGKGCVFPQVVPVFTLLWLGEASGVALHVSKAINSGLTSDLTRASSAVIDRNRNKACPSSLKRDPGFQCDEYPFASSNQGAASGGDARVFAGCRWAAVPGSGPMGFSRCQVDGVQNGKGGDQLNSFYRAMRVIVNDKYKVKVS
ncbi:NucA/NucB deoxyribonuclease domain-containing protein [Microbacterium resistens]|uniref:NucA/NucB deoxyribonuclease domain-containing protein n=1 Tax=Microbacterium resistens TaxID=156977 RepID=UPI00083389DB|nr:hypothetical protein [Microbacterium resistens]